jgi:phosphoribosylformylglycinamidine synthase subunit PurS
MNRTGFSRKRFVAVVSIENKKYLPDPEGETILKDLILKGGFNDIEAVRCSRTIRMMVSSKTQEQAKRLVVKICKDLRLYNPVISKCTVSVSDITVRGWLPVQDSKTIPIK